MTFGALFDWETFNQPQEQAAPIAKRAEFNNAVDFGRSV